MPAAVQGDGGHDISTLISLANADPNRGLDRRWKLYRITPQNVDIDLLEEQGLQLSSVPASGRLVLLRRDIDHTEGGSTHEVLELVHPLTLQQACIATQCIGLDLAGVDLMAHDISRPLHEQGGGFLELNAEPGIGLHLPPMCDRPRPVDEAIIESLFLNNRPKRIPVVLVLSIDFDNANVAEAIKCQIPNCDSIGFSSHGRTSVGNATLLPRSSKLSDRLNAMLSHPDTQYAVASASLAEVLESGVGVDWMQAVVLLPSIDDKSGMELEKSNVSQLTLRLFDHCDKFFVPVEQVAWMNRLTSSHPKVIGYQTSHGPSEVWA